MGKFKKSTVSGFFHELVLKSLQGSGLNFTKKNPSNSSYEFSIDLSRYYLFWELLKCTEEPEIHFQEIKRQLYVSRQENQFLSIPLF